jgi:hypothetical protein
MLFITSPSVTPEINSTADITNLIHISIYCNNNIYSLAMQRVHL